LQRCLKAIDDNISKMSGVKTFVSYWPAGNVKRVIFEDLTEKNYYETGEIKSILSSNGRKEVWWKNGKTRCIESPTEKSYFNDTGLMICRSKPQEKLEEWWYDNGKPSSIKREHTYEAWYQNGNYERIYYPDNTKKYYWSNGNPKLLIESDCSETYFDESGLPIEDPVLKNKIKFGVYKVILSVEDFISVLNSKIEE